MASISAALHDLLATRDLAVEDALTRHFTDDYRQSTDGEWIDRATFAQQMEQLRGFVDAVEITVLDELSQGSRYAERHVIRVTGRDGSVVGQEVYVFAEVAEDGRFGSLEELSRPLSE
ncbi:hypothetical protein [Humibacter sp.]|jgi:hypothetical protein|uniref:hypothetical protein n=1 Tax=Humibacter sp. TaxID=1940291 RepID=UPI002BC9F788|nr:hypothetical protein [Humibacter sp.]HVX07674.1 hypothetical protein [Humibacter sp.]